MDVFNLAGGVLRHGEGDIIAVHAPAVVAHRYFFQAPFGHLHVDPPRAGVDRVFHKLLDHRERAFHHLARRDLLLDDVG